MLNIKSCSLYFDLLSGNQTVRELKHAEMHGGLRELLRARGKGVLTARPRTPFQGEYPPGDTANKAACNVITECYCVYRASSIFGLFTNATNQLFCILEILLDNQT